MALSSSTPKVEHVFVLMLENHSFDNMLGNSGINGLPNIQRNFNSYKGQNYAVGTDPAPCSMDTDPGHEMIDVLQQLTNTPVDPSNKSPKIPNPYPTLDPNNFPNGTGYVANYVNNFDEDNKNHKPTNFGNVMKCFSADQVPVMSTLAAEYAVCTNWFSSIPGPTWSNRLFAHFGSALGLDLTPTTKQIEKWFTRGINHPKINPSIFDKLQAGNYHIYSDFNPDWLSLNHYLSQFSDHPRNGSITGAIPQVNSIHGITFASVKSVYEHFENDLNNSNYPAYTFIEPHYGELHNNTYAGGSSQHPMDDIAGGEALIKFVYEKLKANQAMWEKSLLIITYDEHGGFYDSVAPGPAVVPSPSNPDPYGYNSLGFHFDHYGVRVPAVIVSPYIQKGTVSTTVYDHTSILATLRTLFTSVQGLPLTNRDANAENLLPLLTLSTPRTDTLTFASPSPCAGTPKIPLTNAQRVEMDSKPLPESGNLIGTMGILLKTHYEHSRKNFISRFIIRWKYNRIKTHGDLKAYAKHVMNKVNIARNNG